VVLAVPGSTPSPGVIDLSADLASASLSGFPGPFSCEDRCFEGVIGETTHDPSQPRPLRIAI
jgi:hypothetical protein